MQWRVKGLVQKALGYVPFGEEVHYQLQRRLGGLRDSTGELQRKVDDWKIMAHHLAGAGRAVAGARFVEIGTGWYPTFPMAFYLAGAAKLVTYDLTRHMKPELTHACVRLLGSNLPVIAEACGAPLAEVESRYRRLADRLDDRLDLPGATDGVIDYRAPADARRTGLPDGSVDCVFSNSVLEHIPSEVIEGIFQEAMRVLPAGAIMFHSVNCGDHYAYVDSSISQLNYLRYSDSEWELWQNDFLYQNRMRAQEFVALAQKAGFAITMNTAAATPPRLQELRQIPVDAAFSRFSPEELCITTVDFIAKKS